ncbi:MAG: FapA family protein [Lachnospiraceae bacterium]|nr:FapA family protein [Lachnospiraceae bacterium]
MSDALAANQKLNEIGNYDDTMNSRLSMNQSYVRVDQDNMKAWLFLMPLAVNEAKYTVNELEDFMKGNGIVSGYHKSNLKAMCKKSVYKREINVANGKPPEDGVDGYFEYHFDATKKEPEIKEDGTVDYASVNKLINVRVGDKLATYHQAAQGIDGEDVLGNVLKAKIAKDIPILRGTYVSRRDTENIYFAEREGKVELRDGKIDIQNIHEVFADVDINTGKIEFFGDVIINGNVESGVTIRAGRNIEVRGSVEAASLFAGGDVILQRGIQGQQRGRVSARGQVFAKFIEQTIINAGGDIVADTIMNSRVNTDGKVILSGKRGMLIGGYTHALLGVATSSIGNDVETRTVVHVGCEAEVIEKGISLKKREVQVRNMLSDLNEELEELKKKSAIYGEQQQKMLEITAAKVLPQEKELKEELAVLLDDQQEIQSMIAKGKGSSIRVDGNIYRGAVICISQLQMPVENNTMFMEYTIQGGLVVGNVIIR